jgi:biopolymer transport protein ExbB
MKPIQPPVTIRSIRRFSFAAFLLLAACAVPCAMAEEKKEEGGEAAPKVHNKTLISTLAEGGIVMIPLAICSMLMVYLAGDGYLRTMKRRAIPAEQLEAAKGFFRQANYQGAYDFCKANPSSLSNVLRVGISLIGEGKSIAETGMAEELSKENSFIQTRLSYLSVIGVCTPMIGLLGTVTGMIKAFSSLGTSGIGDPSGLSAAIGEVLVATASGLFVAIPAFGMFYFVKARATAMVHDINDSINMLFRAMPYGKLAGHKYGDDEIFASAPAEDAIQYVTCPSCAGLNYPDAPECAHCGHSLASATPADQPQPAN